MPIGKYINVSFHLSDQAQAATRGQRLDVCTLIGDGYSDEWIPSIENWKPVMTTEKKAVRQDTCYRCRRLLVGQLVDSDAMDKNDNIPLPGKPSLHTSLGQRCP